MTPLPLKAIQPWMRLVLTTGLVLLALAPVQAALACTNNMPPRMRVQQDFDAVVIAKVTSAGYTGETGPDLRPWKATARLQRVIEGAPQAETFEFGRSGSTAACDDAQDPPAVGEIWVLYLTKHQGRLAEHESYPLDWARVADARFHPQEDRRKSEGSVWLFAVLLLGLVAAPLGAAAFLRLRRRPDQRPTNP